MIAKSSIQPLTRNCFNRLSRTRGLPADFQCRRELPISPASISQQSPIEEELWARVQAGIPVQGLSRYLLPQAHKKIGGTLTAAIENGHLTSTAVWGEDGQILLMTGVVSFYRILLTTSAARY